VTGVQSTVLEFLSKGVASQYVAPLLALGGLDSREARHELSRLHADLTLAAVLVGASGQPSGSARAPGPDPACAATTRPAKSRAPDPRSLMSPGFLRI